VVHPSGVDPMLVRDDLPELQQAQQVPSLHAFPLQQQENMMQSGICISHTSSSKTVILN
jgi:hypothetical protein